MTAQERGQSPALRKLTPEAAARLLATYLQPPIDFSATFVPMVVVDPPEDPPPGWLAKEGIDPQKRLEAVFNSESGEMEYFLFQGGTTKPTTIKEAQLLMEFVLEGPQFRSLSFRTTADESGTNPGYNQLTSPQSLLTKLGEHGYVLFNAHIIFKKDEQDRLQLHTTINNQHEMRIWMEDLTNEELHKVTTWASAAL